MRDPSREGQRGPALRVTDAIGPQAAERAQSILGVVKPLGNRKSVCPGRTRLETRTSRIGYRRSKCGVQLHRASRASAHARWQAGECAYDTPAPFVHQRQPDPETL